MINTGPHDERTNAIVEQIRRTNVVRELQPIDNTVVHNLPIPEPILAELRTQAERMAEAEKRLDALEGPDGNRIGTVEAGMFRVADEVDDLRRQVADIPRLSKADIERIMQGMPDRIRHQMQVELREASMTGEAWTRHLDAVAHSVESLARLHEETRQRIDDKLNAFEARVSAHRKQTVENIIQLSEAVEKVAASQRLMIMDETTT
jgi:hypothetical protein